MSITSKTWKNRILLFLTAFIMAATGMVLPFGGGAEGAYAKEIGNKNEQQKQACDAVSKGDPPTYGSYEYKDLLGDKSVYSGGNSYSKTGNYELDTQINDFAKPLPYGNTYVDTSKLNWDDPSAFVIDIKDNRFKWVSSTEEPLRDAENHVSTNDPMGLGKGVKSILTAEGVIKCIAYVGELTSFHDDIKAAASDKGETNVIKPGPGVPYLYRITYKNAVVLPDGTRGNLVLTMTKVQIETSVTISAAKPYKLTDKEGKTYEYMTALVQVQAPNQLSICTHFADSEDNQINQRYTLVKTAKDSKDLLEKINENLDNKDKIDADIFVRDKYMRNAMGDLLDLDIEVTDAKGNPVEGTISYAAHDMDFESVQNIWGRTVGSEFAEGMKIVSGSQSYALVPEYRHDKDGKTRDKGWVPVGPGEEALDRPLRIEHIDSGSNADGVRFASPFLLNIRDTNGKLDNVIYYTPALPDQTHEVATAQGVGPGDTNYTVKNRDAANPNPIFKGPTITVEEEDVAIQAARKQLYALIKAAGGDDDVQSWSHVTAEKAWEVLGNTSWKTYRNDNDNSYDSGFAVLLDAKKSHIQWSGSRITGSTANTTLFNSSVYTYVETTHGTGGGIYLESYDTNNNCAAIMNEGVTVMGRYSDATVTAVPEQGYRVSKIRIGEIDSATGKPGTLEVFDIDDLDLTPGKPKEEGGYTFELNDDGTVDVTAKNITTPLHFHADYTADLYFYKVWKNGKSSGTADLNMTAMPYAFIPIDVTIGGVKYSIDGRTFSGGGKTYELDANDILFLDDGSQYQRVGNDMINVADPEDVCPIKQNYAVNKDAGKKYFTVTRADAESGNEPNVEQIEDGNDIIWKIKYPSDGYETKAGKIWPELPIETEPDSHDYNHVERNYWFATEEVPGWANAAYDNSGAETAGVLPDNHDYSDSNWAKASIKDHDAAQAKIQAAADDAKAYMSVFRDGGEIVNVPALIVNATKKWKDQDNKFNDRKEIWFHIDRVVKNGNTTTTIQDILPPQKIAADASGDALTKTWGTKEAYDTDPDYGVVVGTMDDLPTTTSDGTRIDYTRSDDGYYEGSDGNRYYVNELGMVDKDGNACEYVIRETDKNGNDVDKTDIDVFIKGYTTEIDSWDDFTQSTTEGVKTYSGDVENTLEVKDIAVTKEWIGPAPQTVTLTLYNGTEPVAGIDPITVNKGDFTAAGISTKAYSFTGLPKYIDGEEASYKVVETPANGTNWSGAVGSFQWEDSPCKVKVTNTNNEMVEVPVTKVWDDDSNRDGVRPEALTYVLKANGEKINEEEVPVASDGKAEYTFTEDEDGNPLRKYDAQTGQEITYTVTEEDIPVVDGHATGYTSSVTKGSGGFTVKNTHVPETVKITLKKKWVDDGADNRPESIQVVVKAGGEEIETVTLTAADDWSWTSEDLYKYSDGEEIEYTAEEVVPEDYAHDDGDNKTEKANNVISIQVKNTTLIEVQGNKEWVGEDAKYGVRPESLDIQLLQTANGQTSEVSGAVVTTDGDENWAYSFGKLPAYTDDEYKITYSVAEVDVPPAYTQEVNGLNLVNTLVDPPVGEDRETYGKKGDKQYQDATEMFEKGTGEIKRYELIDPKTGKPTDQPVPAYDENGKQVGTYTIDEDGKITFTPDPDFVGTPTPATVRATDENGLWAEADYTPHVKDTMKTVKRTITWVYYDENKTPVRKKVVQEATFIGEVDPKTGEIISWGDPKTMDSIDNPKVKGWNPDITVPEWTGTPDNPPKDIQVVYYPEPPKGTPKKTIDVKNRKQSATITFEVTTPTTPDGKKNRIEKMLLVDPATGREVKKVTVKGEGTYKIDKNGKVTFIPEKDYVGKPSGIKVVGYDSNGMKAETTYTPEVVNAYTVTYTDPATGRTIQKTVTVKGGEPECEPPADPTRKGYEFNGWKKVVKYDSRGNIESITYEAQWVALDGSEDPEKGRSSSTGDRAPIAVVIVLILAAVAAAGGVLARRRRKDE